MGAFKMESTELPLGGEAVTMDTLTVYGFSFQFPSTSALEFNPKFKREGGDVAVKSPEKAVVFFSWGDLAKLEKRALTLEAHAKFSMEKVKKSVQGNLRQLESREVDVNGHTALFNRVSVVVPRRGFFGKGHEQEVTSVHLHCKESGRYFVIYATSTDTNADKQARTMQDIIDSLRCH
jgi:hypothetical protein